MKYPSRLGPSVFFKLQSSDGAVKGGTEWQSENTGGRGTSVLKKWQQRDVITLRQQ